MGLLVVVAMLTTVAVSWWIAGQVKTLSTHESSAPHSDPGMPVGPDLNDRALAPLRQQAGLRPCPGATDDPTSTPSHSTPSHSRGSGDALSMISSPCLGAPGQVELARALAGHPALLNVWASWCAPCREELPALEAYARGPHAIAVIGIDVLDSPASALTLAGQLHITYPSVTDPEGTLRRALRWPGVLPVSYLLRSDGTFTRITTPATFASADQIASVVARELGTGKRPPTAPHRGRR
jgi:thiol-disulfide isomerase/thioredoxin